MKSGKRFLLFLIPAILYFLCSLGVLFFASERQRDTLVATATDRHHPATVEELRVDLNRIDYDELATIPGIGKSLAERIIQYRLEHGAFSSVEELDHVSGIGEKKLKTLMEYVYVEE